MRHPWRGKQTTPVRSWAGPIAALLVSITLLALPDRVCHTIGSVLEYSVFAPYRYAVGWGQGSLAARLEVRRLSKLETTAGLDQVQMQEVSEENRRLRRLLGLRRRAADILIPATVVSRERGRGGDVLLVETDAAETIRTGSPVIVPEGLLGSVVSQDGTRLRVRCLTNPQTTASVLDQRTRDEGILRGALRDRDRLVILDVPVQADWQVGDRVITSGLGDVFPRGLLVGTVEQVEREATGPLERAWVRPAASPSRAEEVFVLLPGAAGTGDRPDWFPSDPEPALSTLQLDDGRGLTFGLAPSP